MARILIADGQVFQTPAWDRGMGKYSLELLRSFVDMNTKDAYWDEIHVLVSSRFIKKDVALIGDIKKHISGAKIVKLSLKPNQMGAAQVVEANRVTVQNYIDKITKKGLTHQVDFIVLSPMQGELCSVFPDLDYVQNIALCYDLIPLMMKDIYLTNPLIRQEYLSKVKELLLADKYLCISKTCANDLALYLGIDSKRLFNIDGGPINHSKTQKKISINSPFILMPTGNDLRKNNRRAILGFKEFNEAHDNRYTLVITSFFKQHEIKDLSALAPNIIFTGNISGEELNYLYDNTETLLFASEYEGLGLPILEAMMFNKPVVCSDISVFREISPTAFVYCNQRLTGSIASALTRAVDSRKLTKILYTNLLKKYNWEKTAVATRAALEKTIVQQHNQLNRLAVFGFDPAAIDAAGKLMQQCHSELSRLFKVDYFIQPRDGTSAAEVRINYLPYLTFAMSLNDRPYFQKELYQGQLYYIDNKRDYAGILFAALANPGVVILLSRSLKEVWRGMVNMGLIDKSRIDLESELNDVYKDETKSYLTSLVATGSRFVVFDHKTKNLITGIAKAVNVSVEVILCDAPASVLPYLDILPQKKNIVGIDGEGNTNDALADKKNVLLSRTNDYEYFESISRCRWFFDGETKRDDGNAKLRRAMAHTLGVVTITEEGEIDGSKERALAIGEFVKKISGQFTNQEETT